MTKRLKGGLEGGEKPAMKKRVRCSPAIDLSLFLAMKRRAKDKFRQAIMQNAVNAMQNEDAVLEGEAL